MTFSNSISEEYKKILKEWSKEDRMETLTCRPVIDGQRVAKSEEVFHFLFFDEKSEELMGNIFYFDLNERNRSCEFGYKINPAHRNKGYGKKMLSEFIDFMFTENNFNKLYCQTASFNQPSVKLLESLGFTRDGVLREHHELEGKLFDDYIYSILRSDWH